MGFKTVAEHASDLKAGKVSSVELVSQAIQRIENKDVDLNAVVVRDFERALEAARKADEAIAAGKSGAQG